MIKMSSLIEKTANAKATNAKAKVQNGLVTVLRILNNDLQGAEMLPGSTLKLSVASVVGDEFDAAIKCIGSDTLKVGNITIWRSTTSRGVIQVDGINPSKIDEQWNELIEDLKDRAEML